MLTNRRSVTVRQWRTEMAEVAKNQEREDQSSRQGDEVELFDPWDQEFRADVERRNAEFDF